MWQKFKPKKHNIFIKQMSESSVAIMVETHFKLNTTDVEVDN
jgi:hypothetical protein